MIKETQQLLIIVLGIIAVLCILKEYEGTMYILATIVGILGGFLTGKKFIVDPSEQRILSEGEGDVQ